MDYATRARCQQALGYESRVHIVPTAGPVSISQGLSFGELTHLHREPPPTLGPAAEADSCAASRLRT